ncbi:hypothetical protein U9M48_039581 [Paspalum notatum var. saurae]|uniref:Retrotransposon gag domain-containing protein n=1 Tax=Paspalum notatum var. saurae TaxID=547442 RepID=A0AAQ3UKB2_PASNO
MFAAGTGLDMSWKDLSEILKNQYGITPIRGAVSYTKPYPEVYDHLEAPPKFKIPDFTKFSGNDGASTVEHVSRYLAQQGIASRAEHMKIRLFSLSLTGPAFGWYTTLAPGSITTWKQLEESFHAQFFSGSNEATFTDLNSIHPLPGEPVHKYIQQFRELRNQCYSLYLNERILAQIAYNRLKRSVMAVYGPTDFDSIGHLVSKVSAY